MGSSVAFFLKHELGFAGTVTVFERDPSYANASTSRSASSIRLQFSTPENIRMSAFGVQFLKSMRERFGPEADPSFREGGYLIMGTEAGVPTLESNAAIQRKEGADTMILRVPELNERFAWLNTDGVGAASYGPNREGWFDPQALLNTFKRGARTGGAQYVTADVTGIDLENGRVAAVRLADGRRFPCGAVVNAGGPNAGLVAALAGIPLPVRPHKRTSFVIHCPGAPKSMPLIADITGCWLREEGQYHICGWSPAEEDDRACDPDDLEPEHQIFEDTIWPALATRIPAFEELKVMRPWAGHYDTNELDHNGIIGRHPELTNFYFANGFSGHGIQQSPAVGRAVAELILFGGYRSIDLTMLGYERIAAGRPLREINVI